MYALGIVLLLVGIIGLVVTKDEGHDALARKLCWWAGVLGLIVLVVAVVLDATGSSFVD